MAVSYYNPNQSVSRPGKAYEGTASWYRKAQEAGPATPEKPKEGGAPGPGSGIREGMPGSATRIPSTDYRDYTKIGGGGATGGRDLFGQHGYRAGGQAYPGGVIDPNAPGAGNVYGGLRGGTAGGPVADLAGQLQGSSGVGKSDVMGGLADALMGKRAPAGMQASPQGDLASALSGASGGIAGALGPTGGTGAQESMASLAESLGMKRAPVGKDFWDTSATDVDTSGLGTDAEQQHKAPGSPEFYYDRQQVRDGKMSQEDFKAKYGIGEKESIGPEIRAAGDTIAEFAESDVDIPEIVATNPYQQQIDDMLAGIGADYAGQESHALSQNKAQTDTAMNDLAGMLGARGVGSSLAAMMPGALDVQAQGRQQGADIVSDIQNKQVESKLQQLATLGQMAESQGNIELKAQIENATNAIKKAQLDPDIDSVQLQKRQGVVDAFKQTVEDLETLLDNPNISGKENQDIADALTEYANAVNDPNMNAMELQALGMRLLALLAQSQQG